MTTRADMDDLTAEIVGGLDLVPIPASGAIARRRYRGRRRVNLTMVAVFVLVGVITATVAAPDARGALAEGVRFLERVIRNATSQPARATLLGSALAGTSLGASPDDVIRTLGLPDRRSGEGTQWVYERGLWVLFSGRSLDPRSVVVSILAWRGSGAQTEEGFNVQDGDRAGFRATYSGSDLDERPPLDPTTKGQSSPFRLIVATGRDRDGRTVQLRAGFAGEGRAESVELSRTRTPGEVRLSGTHVLDPFAVSACELITRAAPRAGYATAAAVSTHGDEVKEQVPPDRELNLRLCAYGEDRDWADPHINLVTRPVSRAEVVYLLTGSRTLPALSGWQDDGDGRWIARACAPGHQVVAASPRCHVAVAVSVGPYFFFVYERDDDAARRLASAVVDELP